MKSLSERYRNLPTSAKIAAIGIPAACAGFAIAFAVGIPSGNQQHIYVGCEKSSALVNAQVECAASEESSLRLLKTEQKITATIDSFIAKKKASRVSVWSRDLRTNRWIGVNENQLFSPASLIKVPTLIAYLKYSELDPSILSDSLAYPTENYNQGEYFTSAASGEFIPGKTYSTIRLLEAMIVSSDNNAAYALYTHIDQAFLAKISADLGIRLPTNAGPDSDFVTVRMYANIFRSLYNASYLQYSSSAAALDILSRSDFRKGARSVIPADVPIAEKFAERTSFDSSGAVVSRELHECGIVYAARGPYSFCIMTEGTDFNDLLSVIQEISKELYADPEN